MSLCPGARATYLVGFLQGWEYRTNLDSVIMPWNTLIAAIISEHMCTWSYPSLCMANGAVSLVCILVDCRHWGVFVSLSFLHS